MMEYTNQAPARYQGVMQAARQLMGRISMNLSYVHEGTVTITFLKFLDTESELQSKQWQY